MKEIKALIKTLNTKELKIIKNDCIREYYKGNTTTQIQFNSEIETKKLYQLILTELNKRERKENQKNGKNRNN